jgi:hypothetical protein
MSDTTPEDTCCCDDGTWCSCWAEPDNAALREPHGDVPDDGAIAEIVDALERGDTEVGL